MHVHVTVSLDPGKLKSFDAWWKTEGFKTRSEAIAYLMAQVKPSKGKEVPDDY
jgi:hypothetical protein